MVLVSAVKWCDVGAGQGAQCNARLDNDDDDEIECDGCTDGARED